MLSSTAGGAVAAGHAFGRPSSSSSEAAEASAEAAREAAANGEDPVEALAETARSESQRIGPSRLPEEDRQAIAEGVAADALEELWRTDPELAAQIAYDAGSGGEDGRLSGDERLVADAVNASVRQGNLDGLQDAVVDIGLKDIDDNRTTSEYRRAEAFARASTAGENLFEGIDGPNVGAQIIDRLQADEPRYAEEILQAAGGRTSIGDDLRLNEAQSDAVARAFSDAYDTGLLSDEEVAALVIDAAEDSHGTQGEFSFVASAINRTGNDALIERFATDALDAYDRVGEEGSNSYTVSDDNVQGRLAAMALTAGAGNEDVARLLADRFGSDLDASAFFGHADRAQKDGWRDGISTFFEALPELSDETQQRLFEPLVDGLATTDYELRDAIVAGTTGIFTRHPNEIVDEYAQIPGLDPQTGEPIDPRSEVLAQFFDRALFDPDSPHADQVRETLGEVFDERLADLRNADGAEAQGDISGQLGVLLATVHGGGELALNRYEDEVAQREAVIKQLVDTTGLLTGVLSTAGVPNPAGIPGRVASGTVEGLADALLSDPERPATDIIQELYLAWSGHIENFEDQTGIPSVRNSFGIDYLGTLELLRGRLQLD